MAYEYLPPEVAELIGKEMTPQVGPVVVGRGLIDHWVEALEDANPVYTDEEFAAQSVFGGIISPPAMLNSWTRPLVWTPKEGTIDRSKTSAYYLVKKLLGLPDGIVMEYRGEWYLPVRLGDRLTVSEMITEISPPRTTRLGTGHFVSVDSPTRNQRGELVGKPGTTLFVYGREKPSA